MASQKRLGLFCGDEKITVVEFDKNVPVQVVSSPVAANVDTPSPFSSNLTEEIQVTAVLKKMLEENKIKGGSFYVSLPMKEIVLRSFVIPFVKQDNIQNAVKFEAKKYMPFDIQDLSYVFHTIPFTEGEIKRLQVIFFAVRKETLDRNERIFKQLNIEASYCEPYIVSLSKALLFRKEIKPTEHLAFLMLEENLGRICFIDKGVPQFIREFLFKPVASSEIEVDSVGSLNLKIVNEVLNSFDFYARQFSGNPIEQVLISSDFVQKDLLNTLEAELKIKITKYSSAITTGALVAQNNDMQGIYAMGACVVPPVASLSKFNFIGEKSSKPVIEGSDLVSVLMQFKMTLLALVISVFFLGALFVFFQMQLKIGQDQYDRMSAREGAFLSETQDSIQSETSQNIDKLNQYKNIRTKSDVAIIALRLASHLPVGTMLSDFKVNYDEADANDAHVSIDIQGMVVNEGSNAQMAAVNQMFSDFKNDKELNKYVSNVKLVSLNRQDYNGRLVTGFVIHFS